MKFSKYPKNVLKKATDTPVFHNHNPCESVEAYREQLKINGEYITKDDGQKAFIAAVICVDIVKKKWHNIYIKDPSLLDFLRSAEIKSSNMQFYEECRRRINDDYPDGVCIHFPNEKDSLFVASSTCATEIPFIAWTVGGVEDGFVASIPIQNAHDHYGELPKKFVFLMNLMMYMDIFPECVEDRCPIINKTPSNKNITVSTSGKIAKSDLSREVTPHLRMGHFRVLRSERFKNKRFQAVYVKPCMVKGRAETVYDLKDAIHE